MTKLIGTYIKIFNKLRKKFFAPGTKCFVLSGDGAEESYRVIYTIDDGWYLKYSDVRGFFKLKFATVDNEFSRVLIRGSALAVGTDIYEIQAADNTPPQGTRPYWTIAAQYTGDKSFTPES